MRILKSFLLICCAAALAAGTAWADGASASSGQSNSRSATTAAKTKLDAKDPVAMAFRLPNGTKFTAKQEKAYATLKTKYEATLREALDLLHSKDRAEQTKGLKLNRETRAQIKSGIKEIIDEGYADAQRAAAAEAAAYQAAHPRPMCPCGR